MIDDLVSWMANDIAERIDREIMEELCHSNPCAEVAIDHGPCEIKTVKTVKPDGAAPAMPSDSGVHPWLLWDGIRRVSPGMIMQELSTVQSMSMPSAGLFYLDYKYGAVRTSADRDLEAKYHGYSSYADMAAQLGLDPKE